MDINGQNSVAATRPPLYADSTGAAPGAPPAGLPQVPISQGAPFVSCCPCTPPHYSSLNAGLMRSPLDTRTCLILQRGKVSMVCRAIRPTQAPGNSHPRSRLQGRTRHLGRDRHRGCNLRRACSSTVTGPCSPRACPREVPRLGCLACRPCTWGPRQGTWACPMGCLGCHPSMGCPRWACDLLLGYAQHPAESIYPFIAQDVTLACAVLHYAVQP